MSESAELRHFARVATLDGRDADARAFERIADFIDRRASPTPPTTEGREDIVARLRLLERKGYGPGNFMSTCADAAAEIERLRLLSSPRVEDVRREERERIARIFEGQTHSEWLGQEAADMIRSLSPPDGDGKQEQATRSPEDGRATAPTDRL